MVRVIEKGHWRAQVDPTDLENPDTYITMYPLQTSEAMMAQDGIELQKEYTELLYMINDYVNSLHELQNGELAYAV